MNAARILPLVAAFTATAAVAQPAQSYLVINNTGQVLLCSTRIPNGLWQPWFEVKPGANWTGESGNQLLEFQCRPPVAQVSYTLKPGQRYSLLQSGTDITLVEITG
jgi:hypothetical protein